MRIDWAAMVTIFLAVVLAELFIRGITQGNDTTNGSGGTEPTAIEVIESVSAQPKVVYQNPIDQYLSENYPNAL